jgi:lactoylglutathione lyase
MEAKNMKAKFLHNNFNVVNLEKSIAFYKEALGLTEASRHVAKGGSFIIVFLSDGETSHQLELTWMRDRKEPYNLGDNEIHLAFKVEDKTAAYALHKIMNCICYENYDMGLYFIADPDGYWLEILG